MGIERGQPRHHRVQKARPVRAAARAPTPKARPASQPEGRCHHRARPTEGRHGQSARAGVGVGGALRPRRACPEQFAQCHHSRRATATAIRSGSARSRPPDPSGVRRAHAGHAGLARARAAHHEAGLCSGIEEQVIVGVGRAFLEADDLQPVRPLVLRVAEDSADRSCARARAAPSRPSAPRW